METAQEYYQGHGAMTSMRPEFAGLPTDLGALRDIVQGLLIHVDIGPWLYDVQFSQDRKNDKHVRSIARVLERIEVITGQPLVIARKPNDRFAGVCRHFSLMLCNILRQQGVPARTRVGFGAYFNPGKFEDHWVCEYWNAAQSRWILVDAQLDAMHRRAFKIDFDPLDVPRDRFIIAGDAWQMCRDDRANPNDFGLSAVPHLHGRWFIAGNVLRDLAALNRMEMLPWDVWGMMSMDDAALTEETAALLDRIAMLTLAGDEALPETRRIYESNARLRVPDAVFNAERNTQESVAG